MLEIFARASLFKLCALLIFLVFASIGAAAELSLLSPKSGSLVEGEIISVVIKINNNDAIDGIAISRNSSEILSVSLEKGKKVVCKTIKLSPGANSIQVNAIKGTLVTETHRATVYYLSAPQREQIMPQGYKKIPFHIAANEKACVSCHTMEPAQKDIKPKTPQDSVCYQCHKALISYSFVHGPSARWECSACHKMSAGFPRYEMVRESERDTCFSCHSDSKKTWLPKKFIHKPIESGKCTICHNPHASDFSAMSRKSFWDLCVTCHADRSSGLHVASGFTKESHPTKGKRDPLHPSRELSCVSCHSPHTAVTKILLINDLKGPSQLCQACHKF